MSQEEVELAIDRILGMIPGWCTSEKAKRMSQLARGATLCVELGVFGGRGVWSMALALHDQGFGRADGVDPFTADAALEGTNDAANADWWSHLNYDVIEQYAKSFCHTLSPYARLVRATSRDAVPSYADHTIDVLHQDSNHSEEVSCEEVEAWLPKVRRGGLWIFDDADWSTTQRAQVMLVQRGCTLIEDHVAWKVFRTPRPETVST
jgi:predicted O-methyltransferase YrrM